MASTNNSGEGSGNKGSKQIKLEQLNYENKVKENEKNLTNNEKAKYSPTLKHQPRQWGSLNPIMSNEDGQELLETGYKYGKQIFNITKNKEIVKFQPDNTGGYHSYTVLKQKDLPNKILKMFFKDKKITRAEYNKLAKRRKKINKEGK